MAPSTPSARRPTASAWAKGLRSWLLLLAPAAPWQGAQATGDKWSEGDLRAFGEVLSLMAKGDVPDAAEPGPGASLAAAMPGLGLAESEETTEEWAGGLDMEDDEGLDQIKVATLEAAQKASLWTDLSSPTWVRLLPPGNPANPTETHEAYEIKVDLLSMNVDLKLVHDGSRLVHNDDQDHICQRTRQGRKDKDNGNIIVDLGRLTNCRPKGAEAAGHEAEKVIKLTPNGKTGVAVPITLQASAGSNWLWALVVGDISLTKVTVLKVSDEEILHMIVRYLQQFAGYWHKSEKAKREIAKQRAENAPTKIAKPLKKKKAGETTDDAMAHILNQYELRFLQSKNSFQLLKLVLASNYMDVQSLLHLGVAGIAYEIQGMSPEDIVKYFTKLAGGEEL